MEKWLWGSRHWELFQQVQALLVMGRRVQRWLVGLIERLDTRWIALLDERHRLKARDFGDCSVHSAGYDRDWHCDCESAVAHASSGAS